MRYNGSYLSLFSLSLYLIHFSPPFSFLLLSPPNSTKEQIFLGKDEEEGKEEEEEEGRITAVFSTFLA